MVIKITNVQYDTDGDEEIAKKLPKVLVCVTDDCDNEETIDEIASDFISNKTGFCHKGFTKEILNFKYNKVDVTTKEVLNELYNCSALTIPGIQSDDDNFQMLLDWLKQYTEFKKDTMDIYIIRGKVMNDNYQLVGDNKFQDDLNIVSIKLTDLKEPTNLCIPKLEMGFRWFDDLVDNLK